jgi:ornithine carbamoyltransferase
MARKFLEVDDLTPAEFATVLDVAEKGKADPSSIPHPLANQGVVLLFEKPSARTRASTEMAVVALGGHPIYVRPQEVGLGVRESVADVARTFAGYCSVIAARVFDHDVLEEMAAAVDVPVVNLLSDRAHPTQAVADFLTIRELLGSLEGRRLAYVGDGNNVTASLAYASALSGVELVVASPPGYELDDLTVERVRNLGGALELTHDPYDAVAGATSSTPTCGPRWDRRPRARRGGPRSPASPSTRRCWAAHTRTRGSSTACLPIVGKRSTRR